MAVQVIAQARNRAATLSRTTGYKFFATTRIGKAHPPDRTKWGKLVSCPIDEEHLTLYGFENVAARDKFANEFGADPLP